MSGRASEPGGFRSVALSPDGARAVASRTNPQDTTKADLWLFDLSRGSGATRLTLGAGIAEFPVWSPEGKHIVFTFNNIQLRQKADKRRRGRDRSYCESNSAAGAIWANSWSPDGRSLLYATYVVTASNTGSPRIFWASGATTPRRCHSALDWIQRGTGARFWLNGRWVAYVGNQSGLSEVYVREFATNLPSGSASTGATNRKLSRPRQLPSLIKCLNSQETSTGA